MPRFFFDTNDHSHDQDDDGIELPNAEMAKIEAIRFCGALLQHEPDRLAAGSLSVDVRNEDDQLVSCITVTKSAPTISG